MTEKRYSLVYYADKGGAFIKNNETGTEWYHDSRASLLEIVNELNGLAEENKELKVTNGEMEDYLARMEEENKELRSDRDYWKTLAQSLAKTNGTLKLKDEHIGWKRVDVE